MKHADWIGNEARRARSLAEETTTETISVMSWDFCPLSLYSGTSGGFSQ